MYANRSVIFDIPKREVESQCINQSSELLPRSKAKQRRQDLKKDILLLHAAIS